MSATPLFDAPRPTGDIVVAFFVAGLPVPGGSKVAYPIRGRGGRMHVAVKDSSGPPGQRWRAAVQIVASEARTDPPLEGALGVTMCFTLPRAKWHTGTRGLKPSAPAWPMTRPDVLKLARAVEDACTGIIWRDDAQIVRELLVKTYGERIGVTVTIAELEA